MSQLRRWTFTCDQPGCYQMLVVNVPDGHWDQAGAQAAESRGWRITDDVVLCEDHDPTMLMLRDGERRATRTP